MKLAKDPALRVRFECAGRQRMRRDYDLEGQIEQLELVLSQACKLATPPVFGLQAPPDSELPVRRAERG